MANSTARLTNDALAFLTERHLAMMTTLRADNSPHVVAVGFTFDPTTHIVYATNRGDGTVSAVGGVRRKKAERRIGRVIPRCPRVVCVGRLQ